jgi:prophage maintenance system killer protein
MYYSEDEKYDPLLFASLLLQKFSTTQVFLDGNKRIAWLSCVHVLSREHLSIEASEEEAIEFCLRISTDSSLTIEFISSWLADRLRSMELDNAWEEDPQEQFPF